MQIYKIYMRCRNNVVFFCKNETSNKVFVTYIRDKVVLWSFSVKVYFFFTMYRIWLKYKK